MLHELYRRFTGAVRQTAAPYPTGHKGPLDLLVRTETVLPQAVDPYGDHSVPGFAQVCRTESPAPTTLPVGSGQVSAFGRVVPPSTGGERPVRWCAQGEGRAPRFMGLGR